MKQNFYLLQIIFLLILRPNLLLGENASAQNFSKNGKDFFNEGKFNEALQSFEKAKEIFNQNGDIENYANSMFEIADCYRSLNQFESAEKWVNETNEIALEHKFEKLASKCIFLMGLIDMNEGEIPSATTNFLNALKLGESTQNTSLKIDCFRELGNLNSRQGNMTLSNEYFQKGLESAISFKDSHGEADFLANIGANFLKISNYDLAEKNILKSLEICNKMNFKATSAINNLNLGNLYVAQNKLNLAEINLDKANIEFEETSNQYGMAEVLNAKAYLSSKQTKWQRAADFYDQSAKLSKAIKANDLLEYSYRGLAYIAAQKRDFETAYKFNMKAEDLEANNPQMDNLKQTTSLQMKYEFDKIKEQEKIHQELKDKINSSEKKIQYGFIVFLIIAVALLLSLVFSIYKISQTDKLSKQYLQEKNELIEKQKEQSEKILANILPQELENKLLHSTSNFNPQSQSTAMFVDFHDFHVSETKFEFSALHDELDVIFRELDSICKNHQLDRIKTLGDGYLCLEENIQNNTADLYPSILAAKEIIQFMNQRMQQKKAAGLPFFELKIGIHTGAIFGGIIGIRTLSEDLWGDTVQMAADINKMAKGGEILVSESCYNLKKEKFSFTKIENNSSANFDIFKLILD